MKKYTIYNTVSKGENNAGSKAGKDASDIAEKNGYEFVKLYETKGTHTTVYNVLEGYFNIWRLCRKLKKGDIVLLQYPVNRQLMNQIYKMLNRKQVHLITLIHDIDFLRNISLSGKGVEGMRELELLLLSQSEYIIAHNPSMIKTLEKNGLSAKFVSLDLFDYLYAGSGSKRTDDGSLIVAGNLDEQKSGYIYKLQNQEFKLSLYGGNLGENFRNGNAEYRGSFPPDDLIKNLSGSYGLVWDGPEINTCAGNYGQYLKINNPHKVSLYMAAGIPVVVWKQSALYSFVIENGVGFGVDSLLEIDDEMKKQNYDLLVKNVQRIQEKVRTGEFLKKALAEIESKIEA